MLVHVRTRTAALGGNGTPPSAFGCGPTSSSSSGISNCRPKSGGSSPAPFAPVATAACPESSWSALLATSKRIRTERAFAAACMRLAAKMQERREVTRTVTEPLAAASGTSGRIIMNAEVCVLRWLDWDLLAGFVPEDAHLICGVGWER
ncbi:hypothetical protein HXX76_005910 [Chlamydomonas incerta]|uniref:Uncharacterized protein n=1 Tax=Chlamydomonas incerta TaxID=51695 RepID=A0A835W1M4_CHLIN|nr:hypothetical protein HXX76_005910 [Chlamydomonas incerta]|eukprot:KAG2437247.1 hypothetical protein HXX76_005910 [Chlamydomonas incerta]